MSPQLKLAAVALALIAPLKGADVYSNFIRQQQQTGNVVWDMPVAPVGTSPAALLVQEGGALFQLWTINQNGNKDYLLDQKIVGAYLPKGAIVIRTLDSYNGIPRIRADQPFSVDFNVSNLLSGPNVPLSATKTLAEHHLAPNLSGNKAITVAQALSNTPSSSGYIEQNGTSTFEYAATSIQAPNPLKARGEEHFVLHALADGTFTQTQIATAFVQVWPMADGKISGIINGQLIRGTPPVLTVAVNDLYPDSTTSVKIFSTGTGTGPNGKAIPGSVVVLDQELPASRILSLKDYGNLFDRDGAYRIDLLTVTPYGTERLDTVSFTVNRSLRIRSMLVDGEVSKN